MDEAPLLILTNYHVTISLRRSYDVQDNRLWASEPIWFDQSDPPSRACWVYALQQAEELRELKRRLPRAAVPPTIEGCHIKPRQQQAHRQRQQIAAEQQAAEASSAGSSKRQCTEEQQPYVHGSSAHPAWERTAEEQAGEPSSSGRPLRRRRARSSTGRGYKGTEAHFPPEAQPAAASLSPPEVQEMVSLSELGLTDELLGAGQFGYTFKVSLCAPEILCRLCIRHVPLSCTSFLPHLINYFVRHLVWPGCLWWAEDPNVWLICMEVLQLCCMVLLWRTNT